MESIERTTVIVICGVGALGGNIAESLSRQGFVNLKIVDKDIIEKRNIHTQPYFDNDVGKSKVKVLAERLYRINKTNVSAMNGELNIESENFIKRIKDSGLIIDCFDNTESRQLIKNIATQNGISCLHTGIGEDYGEVVWNEKYTVPKMTGRNPCDNPDSRELVLIATAIACRSIREYLTSGEAKEKNNYSITMKDLKIEKW